MLVLLLLPVLFLVTCAHRYLQLYAPSNAVISRARITQPHSRSALTLGFLAASTLAAMHLVVDAITAGAPGWLNLVVLVLAWDAIKFGLAAAFVAHAALVEALRAGFRHAPCATSRCRHGLGSAPHP